MKKSIKKFLIVSQVLGWSALVATACADDQVNKNTNSSVSTSSDSKTSNTSEDTKTNSINNSSDNSKLAKNNNHRTQVPNMAADNKSSGKSTNSTKDMSHNAAVGNTNSMPGIENKEQKVRDGKTQAGTSTHKDQGSKDNTASDHMGTEATIQKVTPAKKAQSNPQGETSLPSNSASGNDESDQTTTVVTTPPGHEGSSGSKIITPGSAAPAAQETQEHK